LEEVTKEGSLVLGENIKTHPWVKVIEEKGMNFNNSF